MVVSYGFTQLDALLQLWESQGLFSVFLPFLLIFAVTYAVLNKSGILGRQAGVNTIVALVVGLLALQQEFLRRFFAELFPRLGVGIGVMVALVILVGLFIMGGQAETTWMIILGSIAFIVFLVVIISTQSGFSFNSWGWWAQWGNTVIWGLILIGIIVAFTLANMKKSDLAGTRAPVPK
jgi:hypothetical protein